MTIDLTTPVGTRIDIDADHDSIISDQGVITGATSQVILYRSDEDDLVYGLAPWEWEFARIVS